LSFSWWWLVLFAVALVTLQLVLGSRLRFVTIFLLSCLLIQADWLKRTDRRSRGVYWVLLAVGAWVLQVCCFTVLGSRHPPIGGLVFLEFLGYLIGTIELCRDFERAVDSNGLAIEMTKLYAFLFGAYYFQFHLHELALSQPGAAPEGIEPS